MMWIFTAASLDDSSPASATEPKGSPLITAEQVEREVSRRLDELQDATLKERL